MKQYKLVKEDDHSYLLHDGEGSFHIAKHPLDQKMHDKIRAFPKFASGGQVDFPGGSGEEDNDQPQAEEPSFADRIVNASNELANGVSAAATPAVNEANDIANENADEGYAQIAPKEAGPAPASIEEPTPETIAPAAAPAQANAGPTPPNGNAAYAGFLRGESDAKAGIQAGADAQAKASTEIAAAQKQFADLQQKAYDDSQKNLKAIDDEGLQIRQAYASQKVDPNRLWNEKSTGAKIGAAIGLLFSGMGSGMTGQPNMAMQVIQRQIDRDIDAQKNDQSKQMNLYKFNRERFQDERMAEQATRLHQLSALQGQLSSISAKYGGPIAQAQAQHAIGQLEMQSTAIKSSMQQSMYQRAMAQQLMGNGGAGAQMDPDKKILGLRMSGMIDEKQQGEMSKQLNDAKNHATQTDAILQAFDKAASENTMGGRVGRLGYQPPSVAAYQTAIMPYLKDAEGRINEQELERTDKLIPSAGSKDATVAENRAALVKFLNEKRPNTGLLKSYNIDTSKFGAMSEKGQSKYKMGPIARGR